MNDNLRLSMKSIYELKKFKNSSDKDLTEALFIYSQNIENVLRTDTREIIYWLDNYNLIYSDRFYLLGFYLNNKIIGFAQLVHFQNEKITFFDYIVIDRKHRRNNTFYEFVSEIQEFISNEGFESSYTLGEVGYYNENNEPTEITRNLIRLLKMSGFGVVKTLYFQPMLGNQNYESELQSVLMMYTDSSIKKIKKDTYLMFVHTIYFKHYKRWYDRFFSEQEQMKYSIGLQKLIDTINTKLEKKDYVEINGYSHLFQTNHEPEVKNRKKAIISIGLLVLLIILILLFSAIHILAKEKFGIDNDGQRNIILVSIISILVISFYFLNKKSNNFTQLIDKLLDKMLG